MAVTFFNQPLCFAALKQGGPEINDSISGGTLKATMGGEWLCLSLKIQPRHCPKSLPSWLRPIVDGELRLTPA